MVEHNTHILANVSVLQSTLENFVEVSVYQSHYVD